MSWTKKADTVDFNNDTVKFYKMIDILKSEISPSELIEALIVFIKKNERNDLISHLIGNFGLDRKRLVKELEGK